MTEAPSDPPRSRNRFLDQVKRNQVALISLIVAVTSLGYNTWRNETTEDQRNIRHAAFRLIEDLSRLQSVANTLAYAPERDPNAWVDGWGLVLSIESLGRVLPDPIPQRTADLKSTWETHFDSLSANDREQALAADEAIKEAISAATDTTVEILRSLD
ncbi:MAG: hypothetical protein R3200_15190 [Xanthomonadales bacterium]|nr:hypothetical protein [Xanthomonadales bacterium]